MRVSQVFLHSIVAGATLCKQTYLIRLSLTNLTAEHNSSWRIQTSIKYWVTVGSSSICYNKPEDGTLFEKFEGNFPGITKFCFANVGLRLISDIS